MNFPLAIIGATSFFLGSAVSVIAQSGPKGWITVGVVAALVVAALIQNPGYGGPSTLTKKRGE